MTTIPTTSVAPLDGKTSIDGKMSFGPDRLSYDSAEAIASRIATAIKEHVFERTVVVADTQFLADLANMRAARELLSALRRDYTALRDEASESRLAKHGPREAAHTEFVPESVQLIAGAGSALAAVPGIASAALGLISLFRQDVAYQGAATSVNPIGFELAVASCVKAIGASSVYIPNLTTVDAERLDDNSLAVGLEAVQHAQTEVREAASRLSGDVGRLEFELDHATRAQQSDEIDRPSGLLTATRRDIQPLADQLGRLDKQFADLQQSWQAVNETSGLSLLARMLRAEAIHAKQPLYVHAQIVASGGHYRTVRTLFRTLFTGDGLSYSGGAIARWAMLNTDGSVEAGGIFEEHRSGK